MKASSSNPPLVNPFVVLGAVLLGATAFAINFARFGFAADAFLWTIRYVVKQAFVFFALSYIASPLHAYRPTSASAFLVRHRATTGAAFAVSQLTAGACVLVVWNHWPHFIHAVSNPVERVLGCMVFAWIITMLATSNQWAIKQLGMRLWSGIHSYGMIVIWITFMMDYLRRSIEWSPLYGVFVLTLLAILALRMRALFGRPAPAAQV